MLLICSLSRNLICHNFYGHALYFSKQTAATQKIKKKLLYKFIELCLEKTCWCLSCFHQNGHQHARRKPTKNICHWVLLWKYEFISWGNFVTGSNRCWTNFAFLVSVCILVMSIYILFVKWLLSKCEYGAFYFLPTCSTRFRNASAYPSDWSAIVFACHSFVMCIAMG